MLVLKLWNSLACQCSCLSLEGGGGRHYHQNVRETYLHLSVFYKWLCVIVCVCWLGHFHALEKEMATHSSVLAWRIPGIGEPGGLPSMESRRVGHDWSDSAAAAAALLSHCLHLCCICNFCSTSRISLYKWFLPRTLIFHHLFNLINSVHLLGLSLNAVSPSKLSLSPQVLRAPSHHVPLQSSSPLTHPVFCAVIVGGILVPW